MADSTIPDNKTAETAKAAANEVLTGRRSIELLETLELADALRFHEEFVLARKLLADTARNILRGQSLTPRLSLRLAKNLKTVNEFGLARRLLARARLEPTLNDDPKLREEIHQQSAICTYKDPDLQADARLDRAFDILRQSCEHLNTTTNQETLGIAGAIYKRKWDLDNQKQQLERALNYYLRGHAQGVEKDQGYNGINAAFILDVLACQEFQEATRAGLQLNSEEYKRIEARRTQATDIRKEIVEHVPRLLEQDSNDWLHGKWWFYATIAEAQFGIKNYDEAIAWLKHGEEDAKARGSAVAPWEYESTARQLTLLARLHDDTGREASGKDSEAIGKLKELFGDSKIDSAYVGKIGLGLSGGGFRASLFHIGVLARLAELDVLRRVEVISCVSGGSIIGAHYYLEVRNLLETKSDDKIECQDYVDIVARVRKDFLAGVQRNIRTRVAVNPFQTIKMIFASGYSRTMRAGDLYEREIFSRVKDGTAKDRWLNGLFICPAGPDGKPDDSFNLSTDNWQRRAKVPNLVLNTTTLNTGHNWQFTASWMGEPPAGIDDNIDGNDRFRRLYYDADDTPKPYRQVRLGNAVSASACVPGLFEALALDELYPDRIVRMVDGGVCDNQGIGSLLEQDCTVVLISDGSGQMQSLNHPSSGILGALLRSQTILQARVRQAQYRELSARKRAGLLRGFMFVHLKEDLDVDPIDWVGCLDPFDASDDSRPAYRRGPLTRYGIARELQDLLAGVRTDLDSFSDVEAFALMTSAYRMTQYDFPKGVEGFRDPLRQHNWDFLEVESGMKGSGSKYDYLKRQLSVSHAGAFKIWMLSRPLKITAWVLAVAAVVFAVWACFRWATTMVVKPITLWDLGVFVATTVVIMLATYLVGSKLMRIVRLRDSLIRIGIGVAVALLGWMVAGIHLAIFDPWFLRHGSIERFRKG